MKNENKKKENNPIKILSIVIITLEVIINIIFGFRTIYLSYCNTDEENKLIEAIENYATLLVNIYYIIFILAIIMLIIVIIKKRKKDKVTKSTTILVSIAVLLPVALLMFSMARSVIIRKVKNNTTHTEPNEIVFKKPIIYIYPTEKTKLKITLNNSNKITHSYPRYNDGWEVIVDKNSNIYDINTKRNYYALYWEGIDNTKVDEKVGFIVSGKDTAKFLEEKLTYLGLTDRELNEFIVYWLPKLENNKYNYIRFRTKEEIETYNKISINHKIDSLIQVYMDYKPLAKKIDIKEQKLEKVERHGFTIVEWGGRNLRGDK